MVQNGGSVFGHYSCLHNCAKRTLCKLRTVQDFCLGIDYCCTATPWGMTVGSWVERACLESRPEVTQQAVETTGFASEPL